MFCDPGYSSRKNMRKIGSAGGPVRKEPPAAWRRLVTGSAPGRRVACASGSPRKSRSTSTASAWCPRRCASWCSPATRSSCRPAAATASAASTATTPPPGARIVPTAAEVFAAAELVVKVKEPQLAECAMLRPGQLLFTYLHLAADRPQAEALMRSGAHAIAYETVTARDGSLPLLTPMSEVAGRMSVQVGATCLQKASGGRGVLLGGVPGVRAGQGGRDRRRRLGHARGRDGARHARRRHGRRPLDPPPARAGRAVPRRGRDALLDHRDDRARSARGRPRDRRGAGARRRRAQAGHRGDGAPHAARARCWSTSRSTRAAASRPAGRRPMRRRPSCCTTSSTTA